jgi:hypothetical protein
MLKLIHVGNAFIDTDSQHYVIPCYFQPWSEEKNCPESTSILTHVVDSSIAGELICGSLWADLNTPGMTSTNASPESQVFWAGADLKSTILLKDLINSSPLTPSTFWSDKVDAWVICVALKDKKVIIPYFELLRTLFYKASRRLTQFFFSFLPLNLLCRPLRHATKENNLTAEFCVASTNLYPEECILLCNLLFNTALKRFFNFSQANQIDVRQNHKLTSDNTIGTKLIGNIGENILFKSNGYNFIHNNEPYFWVESLEIIKIHYNFQRIIFYPISEFKINSQYFSNSLICSDLFHHIKHLNSKGRQHNINNKKPNKITMTDLKSARKFASYAKNSNILTIRGMPWATLPSDKSEFYWLDDVLINNVVAHQSQQRRKKSNYSQSFRDILLDFEEEGYNVTYLLLNNPNNTFGKNVSIFPINGHPPLLGSIHKNSIHSFTIAKIQLSNTVFFLTQPFPSEYPDFIILCQKLNLNSPNELEWNELFSRVTPVYNYSTFYKFNKNITPLARTNSSYNLGLIAVPIPIKEITIKLCIKFTDHIVNVFRKRIQFQIASSLKFPNGLTQEEYQKVLRLSAYMCRVPNPRWTTVISLYWS